MSEAQFSLKPVLEFSWKPQTVGCQNRISTAQFVRSLKRNNLHPQFNLFDISISIYFRKVRSNEDISRKLLAIVSPLLLAAHGICRILGVKTTARIFFIGIWPSFFQGRLLGKFRLYLKGLDDGNAGNPGQVAVVCQKKSLVLDCEIQKCAVPNDRMAIRTSDSKF